MLRQELESRGTPTGAFSAMAIGLTLQCVGGGCAWATAKAHDLPQIKL